jgi:menaquinone-specific isochorismate synthase
MKTETLADISIFQTAKENLAAELSEFLNSVPSTDKSLFFRFEVPVPKLDIIQWLKDQIDEVKTYWRDRESKFEMAGLGNTDLISGSLVPDYRALFLRLNEYLKYTTQDVRYYGGMRFNKKHSSDYKWQSFTSYRFIVPKFEVVRNLNESKLACNLLIRSGENIEKIVYKSLQELECITFNTRVESHVIPAYIKRTDFPDFKGWEKNVGDAFNSFTFKKLRKIVLARKTTLKFNKKINALELLWKLRLNNHRAYYFCFQPTQDAAFIGGTPEQLYYRSGEYLHTEAVAGTRRRGSNVLEDKKLENDLLNSEKDIREHRFVVNSIRSSLKKLCKSIKEETNLSVLKLSQLQHLKMQFTGRLKKRIQDCDILEKIHPTPAVGGVPSEKAISEIENIEQFDRGWYAGPVGWIGKNTSEFAVAIRSGLVYEDELHLYSGAGIVKGSASQNEWEEIENKISGFMKALNSY